MKKFVAVLLIASALLFGGCSGQGYRSELVSGFWGGELSGGGRASLSFNENAASLVLKNAEKSCEIKGKFIADEKTLVIFDEELYRNYGFDYEVSGSRLILRRGDYELELERIKNASE